jgi:hypothetical protein
MGTFGGLKAKVRDDLLLGPSVRLDQVQDAVLTAIAEYEGRRFWFNEQRTVVFNTVVGQSDYLGDDDWGRIISADYLRIVVNCDGHRIDYETPAYVDERLAFASHQAGSQPAMWTTFGGTLRLYPVPDQVYPVRVTGHITYPVLEADEDTNVWTNEAFELIRARAKWDLSNNVTHDQNIAQMAGMAEQRALDRLVDETGRRTSRGYIVPVDF